jgi:hypothetical protein
MILIYGTGTYGKIDLCEGQYAATRFFHLYWMPLFPVSSTMWIQSDDDEHYRGHLVRWSVKSVLAAYLRTWGLFAGSCLLLSSLVQLTSGADTLAGVTPLLLGLLFVGGAAYSYAWRSLPKEHANTRALFASVTGTYCDPELLPDNMVAFFRQQLEDLWEKNFSSQTPNDVARYGAKDPAQAALAYSLVRLLAREADNPQRQDLLAIAETIAKGTPQEKLPQENPYRTQGSGVSSL